MSTSIFAIRPNAVLAALLAAIGSVHCSHVSADVVTEWNEIANQAAATAGAPPVQNRIMAITQIAVHDALNAVAPRFESYTAQPAAISGASPEAAAITAAFISISRLVPARAASLQLFYDHRIAELPACPSQNPACVANGVAAGTAAANDILALRTSDGASTPHLPYSLAASPGVYQPTPPQLAAPQFAGWANVLPFAMVSGSQFRADPDPMMLLHSSAYARDFIEVKAVGDSRVRSVNPDSTRSRVARFWPSGGANWNAVTRVIVSGRGLDLWQHAQLFALLNIAVADSTVATFDTKYLYNFWRPVTAIRAADTDGNPATAMDATWQSYLPTPPYPDYTCGLTTNTGAATEVLRQYFHTDRLPYTFTASGVSRSFDRLRQADADAVDARVFGGMHFRTGCEQGIRQGAKVARFVVRHQLLAL